MSLNVTPLMKAIERYIAKEENDLEDQIRAEGYVAADVAVEAIGELEDGMTDALNDYTDEVLDRMQTAVDIEDFLDNIMPEIDSTEQLEKVLHDIFKEKFDQLTRKFTFEWIVSDSPILEDIIDDAITDPAEAFIKGWSEQLAKIMHLNTKDAMEKILLDASREKKTIEEVADIIGNSGIRDPGYRSRRVAITEVLRVEEYAHQEARVQNPLCYKKKWKHVMNANPRENHMAIHGQTVFKRECFTLTGRDGTVYHPICPRDTCLPASESVHCHCITEDICDESVFGSSKEERAAERKRLMDEVNEQYRRFQEEFVKNYGDNDVSDFETYTAYYDAIQRGEL